MLNYIPLRECSKEERGLVEYMYGELRIWLGVKMQVICGVSIMEIFKIETFSSTSNSTCRVPRCTVYSDASQAHPSKRRR